MNTFDNGLGGLAGQSGEPGCRLDAPPEEGAGVGEPLALRLRARQPLPPDVLARIFHSQARNSGGNRHGGPY